MINYIFYDKLQNNFNRLFSFLFDHFRLNLTDHNLCRLLDLIRVVDELHSALGALATLLEVALAAAASKNLNERTLYSPSLIGPNLRE